MRFHKTIRKYLIPHRENNFRPHLLRSFGISALLVIILGVFVLSNFQRMYIAAGDFMANVLPAVLVDLANGDRSVNAEKSLHTNAKLEEAARLKAQDMAKKGYFAHNSPEGVTPWYWFGQAGYHFVFAGENLAINFNDSSAVNTAWMNSPGHRANILNDNFTEVGIATAQGVYQGRPTIFVVQMFGTPQSEQSAAVATAIPSTPRVETSVKPVKSLARADSTVAPVVTVASSSVLGASQEETFLAVKDTLAATAVVTPTPPQSSLFDRLVTSPTQSMALIYVVLCVLLLIMLSFVLFIRHDRRLHHIVYILLLLLLIAGIYYSYKSSVQSSVIVGEAGSNMLE